MATTFSTTERTQPKRQHVLRELLFSLFVRIPLLATIFCVVFLAALLFAIIRPSMYMATAKFSMTLAQTLDPLEQVTAQDYRNMFQRQLDQQKELIFSNRVLVKVIKALSLGGARNIAKTTSILRAKLKVTPPKGETFEGTTFFYLSFEDRTAHRATKFASAIAEAYLETFRELAQEKADYSHSFYRGQTQELYESMTQKEQLLRDFERDQALILIEILNLETGGEGGSGRRETGPSALLNQFVARYHTLHEELAGIRAALDSIETKQKGRRIPIVPAEMEQGGRTITVFKRKVAQLQIQLNEMKPRFREKFDMLRQVRKELNLNIASLKRELERTIQAKRIEARSIEGQIGELEKTIAELREHIRFTAQEKSKYEQLKQAYTLAKVSYTDAMDKLEQARLAQALDKEKQSITYIDEPVVPNRPFKPNRPLIVFLGLLAAIFLAVATGLIFDYFDHSIRRHEDIEQYLEVPILGSIPRMSQTG